MDDETLFNLILAANYLDIKSLLVRAHGLCLNHSDVKRTLVVLLEKEAIAYQSFTDLQDLTCKTVADEIKGKTPEEIRVRFNIKNDFTPEEEEEVKRENAWCEDR